MRDSAPHPSHVHFSVITPDNVVYTLSMHTFTTIRGLKDELAKQSGIPSHRQSLILSDCLLRDGRTISNYKLQNRDLIHLHTTGSSGFTIPDDPVATAVPATGAQPVPVNPRAGSRGYDNGDDDDNDNDSVTTMSSAEHAGVMRFRFADVCEDSQQYYDHVISHLENPRFRAVVDYALSDRQVLESVIRDDPILLSMGEGAYRLLSSPQFRSMVTSPMLLRQVTRSNGSLRPMDRMPFVPRFDCMNIEPSPETLSTNEDLPHSTGQESFTLPIRPNPNGQARGSGVPNGVGPSNRTNGLNGASALNGTNRPNGTGIASMTNDSNSTGSLNGHRTNGLNGAGALNGTSGFSARSSSRTNGSFGPSVTNDTNGTNGAESTCRTNGVVNGSGPSNNLHGTNGTNGTTSLNGATGPNGARLSNSTNGSMYHNTVNGTNGFGGINGHAGPSSNKLMLPLRSAQSQRLPREAPLSFSLNEVLLSPILEMIRVACHSSRIVLAAGITDARVARAMYRVTHLERTNSDAAATAPRSDSQSDLHPDEERFANQLLLLHGMGYYNYERNLEALAHSSGSVPSAVVYMQEL